MLGKQGAGLHQRSNLEPRIELQRIEPGLIANFPTGHSYDAGRQRITLPNAFRLCMRRMVQVGGRSNCESMPKEVNIDSGSALHTAQPLCAEPSRLEWLQPVRCKKTVHCRGMQPQHRPERIDCKRCPDQRSHSVDKLGEPEVRLVLGGAHRPAGRGDSLKK